MLSTDELAPGQLHRRHWPWDGEAERELASFMDALHGHRAGNERSEMRVHFWERRPRRKRARRRRSGP